MQGHPPTGSKFRGLDALANAIRDRGGILLSVNLLKNNIPIEQAKALASILKDHPILKSLCGNSGEETVLDMSGQSIGAEGAIMLAPEIADNRALSAANLLGNFIPVEQAKELVRIMQARENVTTLCGLSREETELNFHGQKLGAGDAVLFANEIGDMGAMTSLNLSSNGIGGYYRNGYFIPTPEGSPLNVLHIAFCL
jgi:hypothetical protein